MNLDIQLTPHFHLREFLHPGITFVTPDQMENLRKLAQELEKIRAHFNKPIHINSGLRTPAHNKAVGGVQEKPGRPGSGSQHLYGKAADITVAGMTPKEVQKALKDWSGGMGSYTVFTHLDIGPHRRWLGP